jgi:beta-N-acetylglucosaminidase
LAVSTIIGLACATSFITHNRLEGKSIEHYTVDEITGKNQLEITFQRQQSEHIREIDKLRNELNISRGNLERERLQKDKIINAISLNLSGAFKGKAKAVYNAAQNHNFNSLVLAAIMKWETANGTSNVCVKANNPGGINWFKGCGYDKYSWYIKYPTLEQGIDDMADRLERYYINQGLTDISSIAAKYAPLDDKRNGMYGMDNREWPKQVTKIYMEILEDVK